MAMSTHVADPRFNRLSARQAATGLARSALGAAPLKGAASAASAWLTRLAYWAERHPLHGRRSPGDALYL